MSAAEKLDEPPMLYVPSAWGNLYHLLPHNEALGGGAAGPGKTMCLLMDPMQQVLVEHQRCKDKSHPFHQPWGASQGHAIFLRRIHPMLNDVVKRAHRLFSTVDPSVKWNENKHQFTFRSGFIYQFGHCHDVTDWKNYLGFEFSWIGWDELITFEEEQYDQINSRLRSYDPVLRKMLKIRAMSNPMMDRKQGDNFSISDPNWVRRRFIDPAREGRTTLVKKIKMDDGTWEEWTSIYMPAYLSDNPDPEFRRTYEINLQQKKPHIRQALLRGDWYITVGSFFAEVWNTGLHVCKPFKIPKEWPKFRSMDWGFKMPGVVQWYAMDPDGNIFCFRELVFQGMQAKDVAKAILQIEQGLGLIKGKKSKLTGPADTQLWEARGDGTKGKAMEMAEEGVLWVPAKKGPGSRLRNAELLYDRLGDHDSGTTTPGIVFFEKCTEVIKLIPSVGTSDKNSEEPADGNDDHALDACVVAGTLVQTPSGALPIEELRAGDQVLSTDGSYWSCLGGRLTRRQETVMTLTFEGGEITATPDHRFLCADGVWRRLDQLDTGMYLFSPWIQSSSHPQPKSSMESGTISAVSTTKETGSVCTGLSGQGPMGRSLWAFMSIMWMKIAQTIHSTISNFFPVANTSPCTAGTPTQSLYAGGTLPDERQLRPGTPVPRDGLGTENMPRKPLEGLAQDGSVRAGFVARSFLTRALQAESGAGRPVHRDIDAPPALTTWREFALPAGKNSWSHGSRVSAPAHGDARCVLGIRDVTTADVYCTQVPIMGAFVANGVVVSNCFYGCGYASHGRAGLGWKSSDADDKDDDEDEKPKKKQGRWGYGVN